MIRSIDQLSHVLVYYIYIYIMYIYIYLTACFYVLLLTTTQTGCANTLGINGPPKNPKAWSLADLESSCWWEGANPIHGGWAPPVGLMGRSPHPHLPLMVIGLVGGNPENPERTYYKRILRVDFVENCCTEISAVGFLWRSSREKMFQCLSDFYA